MQILAKPAVVFMASMIVVYLGVSFFTLDFGWVIESDGHAVFGRIAMLTVSAAAVLAALLDI